MAFPYFARSSYEVFLEHKGQYRLIVDSGAFTAWTKGKPIMLDDYCRFLDSIEKLSTFKAVQLDVIHDHEASWRNYLIMKERGFDVMPVFTRGATKENLDAMYQHADYIMLGGVVFDDNDRKYVEWFHGINQGRKAHWLGVTATPVLKRFRPFSADSSSWNGAARYARGQLYVGDGELKTFSRKQPLVVSPETITRLQALSIPMDVISWLGNKDAYNCGFSNEFKRERICQVITTLSSIKRAYDIEKNLGTRVYLAAPTMAQLKHILHWHAHMDKKGTLS